MLTNYHVVAPFNVTIHGSTLYKFGDTLELNCTSEGTSELNYSWGRETSGGSIFPVGTAINTTTIIINYFAISDAGSYTCTVSNEAGRFSATTIVAVNGKLLFI